MKDMIICIRKDNEFQFGPLVMDIIFHTFLLEKLVVTMALYTLCLAMIYLPLMF